MTAFYKEKGWWKSRTIWVGITSTLYAALALFGIPLPFGVDMNTLNEAILGIVGLLSIVFRVKATEAISNQVVPTITPVE